MNICHKVHLNLIHAGSLTGLAASTLHIEGKTSRLIALHLGEGQFSKQRADGIKDLHIGTGIGSRRAADGLLIDGDHFIKVLSSKYLFKFTHFMVAAMEEIVQIGRQGLVDKRAFPAARDSCHADE